MANVLSVFREYGRLERMRVNEGLSVEQLERWTALKRILTDHFQTGSREFVDKQSSLRVPSQLKVSFDSYGQLRENLMTNISRGGVFIETAKPLPIGTPLDLQIHVDETGETHCLSGEVATVNISVDGRSTGEGMGIRFTNLSEEQQEIVHRLYGEALERALTQLES